MNEKSVKQAVLELIKSNEQRYEKSFSLAGNSDDIFTVKIERNRSVLVTKSISMEARANTISALPSGSPCGCCNGSGRSS